MTRTITFLLIAALTLSLFGCIDSSKSASSTLLTEKQAIDIATNLFDDVDKLDHLAACAVTSDNEQTITLCDNSYALVTDEDFALIQNLVNFAKNTITANVSRYLSFYNGNSTSYIERGGKLYVELTGKGCGFFYTGEATVSDITENSYIAERPYDNYGGAATLEIKIVLEDGAWKIDEINFK